VSIALGNDRPVMRELAYVGCHSNQQQQQQPTSS